MNDETRSNGSGSSPRFSRRRLLAGAVGGSVLLGAGQAPAAMAAPAGSSADPALDRVLRQCGGEFGQLGRGPGGSHGDL